ncbi:hypothetical protein L218DRAFT_78231 [Marasmius fiardii PR-910]|nr:hypothetical protein L218DRAFT_78231 [Marasmius fiardii PR-910]
MSSPMKPAAMTQQPTFNDNAMTLYHDYSDEKRSNYSQTLDGAGRYEANTPCHRRCHRDRLRRSLFTLVAVLLGTAALFSLACFFGVSEVLSIGAEGLAKRATGTDSTNGNSSFVDRKLYLIVIFVGLVIVVILGICLAAWCCKGSFENPLCCPCYLCACCGGLGELKFLFPSFHLSFFGSLLHFLCTRTDPTLMRIITSLFRSIKLKGRCFFRHACLFIRLLSNGKHFPFILLCSVIFESELTIFFSHSLSRMYWLRIVL